MEIITVIGSLNMDLVVRAKRTPEAGETLPGTDLQIVPGGKGANQAVAAARAGTETYLLGCVGADVFGAALLESLRLAGVNTAGVRQAEGVSTGTALITVEESGENRILIVAGANALVSPGYVLERWETIARSRMVLLQHEIPLETVGMIVEKAHREGIKVVLNPAPFYPVATETLAGVDILVVNESEAAALSEQAVTDKASAFEAAAALRSQGVKTVIVTLGRGGSVLVSCRERLYQPAFKVKATDTTAAGDTFTGGYAARILAGASPAEALLYATAAAALAVSKPGAQPSIPNRHEVEAFLWRHAR